MGAVTASEFAKAFGRYEEEAQHHGRVRNEERPGVTRASEARNFLRHDIGSQSGNLTPYARPLAGEHGNSSLGRHALRILLAGRTESLYALDLKTEIG